ncbi:MAG: adenylate/guanylate cyclase domain-containing protein, partial [Streptosporangiaceae bacterium]
MATQTLTFLFTDIEGSTAMLRRLGAAYAELLSDHHRLIRGQLSAHGGREIDTQGDAFFAVFSSPSSCVTAAIEMQRALASHSWPDGEGLRVRMGIHSGEVSETAVGPVGLDVHRGARIAAAGHGGQVLVSATTAALLRDSMPAGAFLRDLGLHRLKDFGQAEQLFQLEADGLQVAFPPLRSLEDPAVLTNLPARLSSCIGRDAELAELEGLITGSRLVTLTGPGGVGKTRLAIEVAERVAGEFADGVVFVDLAPLRDAGLVLGAIARRLGVDVRDATPLPDLLAVSLRGRRLLVLLDNREHLLPARDAVLALLQACPELAILVTSRVALDVRGGRDYPVTPLVLPGAPGVSEALPGQPSLQHLAHARGHHERRRGAPCGDQAGHLVHKERIAAGSGLQAGRHLVVQASANDAARQGGDSVCVQRRQQHPPHARRQLSEPVADLMRGLVPLIAAGEQQCQRQRGNGL